MKRDNGIGLALGAAAALATAAALISKKKDAGSAARSGRREGAAGSFAKPKHSGVVTERDRELGRQKRSIVRRLEAANSAPVSIEELSRETGLSEEDVISIISPMTKGGGYYFEEIEGKLHAGQASWGMRELISTVKRNIEAGTPEVGVRLMGVLQSVLPETASQEDFTLRSSRSVIEDDLQTALRDDRLWRQFPTPQQGKTTDLMAKIYLEALKDRRFLSMAKSQDFWLFGGIGRDGQRAAHVSLDAALQEWPAVRHLPWMESVVRSGIKKKADEAPTLFYDLKSKWQYVMDYALAEGAILDGMSLDEAYAASEDWHNRNKEKASAAQIQTLKKSGMWYGCPDGIHPIQSPVAVQLPGGWTWQELSTFDELAYEGNTRSAPNPGEAIPGTKTAYGLGCLRHCIGTSPTYLQNAQKGLYKIYSLRTPANRPVQTMTVEMSRGKPVRILQIAGLYNRQPATEGGGGQERSLMKMLKDEGLDYKDYDEYLDAEAKMVDAGIKQLGIPASGPDYEKVHNRLNRA